MEPLEKKRKKYNVQYDNGNKLLSRLKDTVFSVILARAILGEDACSNVTSHTRAHTHTYV